MEIRDLLAEIDTHLADTFAAVDAWFDQPADVLAYVPADQGWSGAEILNHIGLTNHYLLILIEKGAAKALQNTKGLVLREELAGYAFPREALAAVGVLRAFAWMRPEHMEPRSHPRPRPVVRQELREQLRQLLACLHRLPAGEGLLYRTTMSVNGLGRLNVYEYCYFLAQHARRHLTQLAENAAEYRWRQQSSPE